MWRDIPRVKEPYDDVLGISMIRGSFQIGADKNVSGAAAAHCATR
jgi:hypothetical protein